MLLILCGTKNYLVKRRKEFVRLYEKKNRQKQLFGGVLKNVFLKISAKLTGK